MTPTFRDYQLECAQPPAITNVLRYEGPINVTTDNEFAGDCFVGAFTYINQHGEFSNATIGRYCSVARSVCIGPGQHHLYSFSTHPFIEDPDDQTARLSHFPAYRNILGKKRRTIPEGSTRARANPSIEIGHDVWIGTRALVMNGIKIAHGAVIGAGAIVTKDVPPYAIVAGVPARVIRYRFAPEIIEKFLALQWWNYDMSHVSNRVDYGKVEEVIEFMTDRIEAHLLPRFFPRTYELRQSGSSYNITAKPPLAAANPVAKAAS